MFHRIRDESPFLSHGIVGGHFIPEGYISSQASDWAEMSPGDISVGGHFSLVHRQGGVETEKEEGREEWSPVQGPLIFYFLSDLIRSLAVNLCAAFLPRSSPHTKRQIH